MIETLEPSFGELLDSSPIPTFVIDRERRVTLWNRACEQSFGIAAAAVQGTCDAWRALYRERRPVLAELVLAGDAGTLAQLSKTINLRLSATLPGTYEAEAFFPHLGVDGRWLHTTAAPVRNRHGRVVGAVQTVQDVTENRRTQARLQSLLDEHRVIFDHAHVGIAYLQDRVILQCNARMAQMYGYDAPDALVGKTTEMLYPSHDAWRNSGAVLYHRLASAGYSEDEVEQRRRDGSAIWCYRLGRPLDPRGPHGGSIWVYSDITEQKQQKKQLELARTVFDNTTEALMIVDADSRIIDVNHAFTRITGYSADEAVGQKPSLMRSGRHDHGFYGDMWRRLHAEGRWEGEVWDRHKEGNVFPARLSIATVRDDAGAVVNYVGAFSDITKHKQAEAQARFLACHDPLTGLPNRTRLRERFDHAIERARRTGRQLALLLLDLDHFKRVNDALGHPVGDALLVAVAERLRATLYHSDTISRQGGDEFAVLLDDLRSCDATITVVHKIAACLDAPIEVEGHTLSASFSIGISVFPGDGDDFDTLMKKADTAMYHAKKSGRSTFSYFDEMMNAQASEQLMLHGRLRQALAHNEFHLLYQPQINLATGRIFGVEALLRWTPGNDALIGPDRFIPAAEESGLILPIGEWVIHEACLQARRWHDAGTPLRVGINVSGLQIYRDDLAATLARTQRDIGVSPRMIELELTESTLMEDVDVACDVLAALKRAGYSIAIDDFGTGYSSLAYLKKFPLDKLKIDRSFVTGVCENPEDQAITCAVIQIAHSLNLRVIAEGVESEAQRALLQLHGCHEGQGYLFGRPMVANEVAAPARTERRLTAV